MMSSSCDLVLRNGLIYDGERSGIGDRIAPYMPISAQSVTGRCLFSGAASAAAKNRGRRRSLQTQMRRGSRNHR